MFDTPCLSKSGLLRSGEKAEIPPLLKSLAANSGAAVKIPAVDAIVLEGLFWVIKSNQPRTKPSVNRQKNNVKKQKTLNVSV